MMVFMVSDFLSNGFRKESLMFFVLRIVFAFGAASGFGGEVSKRLLSPKRLAKTPVPPRLPAKQAGQVAKINKKSLSTYPKNPCKDPWDLPKKGNHT